MTAGLPLVVTRPEPDGPATIGRARAMGLDARYIPLFAARPLPWQAPDARDFDALLLTSAQAVRLAGPALARLAALPVLAVGAATAGATEAAGLRVVATGTTGAQSLLDAMPSRAGARILWLCGRDRSNLDARGAALVALPCYAVDALDPPAEWERIIAEPTVLMAHSTRAARRIAELAAHRRAWLSLVAISERAAEAAGTGWAALSVAARMDDAAMLAEAHALCHKGG